MVISIHIWYVQLLIKIKDKNSRENTVVYKYLDQKYSSSIQLYTDESKDPDTGHTASEIYIPKYRYKIAKRTSNNLSVCTTEMIAILLALQWVEEINLAEVVICSDSYSAL